MKQPRSPVTRRARTIRMQFALAFTAWVAAVVLILLPEQTPDTFDWLAGVLAMLAGSLTVGLIVDASIRELSRVLVNVFALYTGDVPLEAGITVLNSYIPRQQRREPSQVLQDGNHP